MRFKIQMGRRSNAFGDFLLRIFCFFVTVTLVRGQFHADQVEIDCEKNNNLIPGDLIIDIYDGLILDVEDVFTNQTLGTCFAHILAKLVGLETAARDRNTPFNMFTKGYHTLGIPAVDFWSETRGFFNALRPPLVDIREVMRQAWELSSIWKKCNTSVETAASINHNPIQQTRKNCIKYTYELMECRAKDRTIVADLVRVAQDHFQVRLLKACHKSLAVTMEVLYRAVAALHYNGAPAKWDYSPFGLMLRDALEFQFGVFNRINRDFPAYIDNLTAQGNKKEATFLQGRLDDIKNRLNDPSLPYKTIYFSGSGKEMKKVWIDSNTGIKIFTEEVKYLRNSRAASLHGLLSFREYVLEWNKDLGSFMKAFDDGIVVDFRDKLLYLYSTYFGAQATGDSGPEYVGTGKDKVLVGDGMWDWDAEYVGLHNLRLSWDLMGAVLEELKCYMKDTYYFHLRPEAIKATQRDLKAGALFSGISYTMLQPCRFDHNNEADLVTKYCTAENHEICAPISPFHTQQRPESPYHGGLALLKPRWIYKFDEEAQRCIGRKDYISLMYACRCGFRLDCGDDFGEQITCQLINNDRLRGQCRGGVAYPCKTLPLAPGAHNETCASEFCHMSKNSCEDKPYIYKIRGGGDSLKLTNPFNRFLIQFAAAIVNWGIVINL